MDTFLSLHMHVEVLLHVHMVAINTTACIIGRNAHIIAVIFHHIIRIHGSTHQAEDTIAMFAAAIRMSCRMVLNR